MASLHSRPSSKLSNVPLYRRLLFPDLLLTASPPPILPHASSELNAELYDFLALALRAYITPWWNKITRYDADFLPHVASVISIVIHTLATRLKKADVDQLVLHAVPVVVAQHYADYRAAAAKMGSAYASGGAATLEQLFHQYQSHMGIDAEGNIDATYVRHLIELILQACLPVEDQESESERTIIREVIVKVLLQDVFPMLVQPWFIHRLMLDQLRSGQEADAIPVKAPQALPTRPTNSSFHTAVVLVLSTVQYLSGLCLILIQWYKQAKSLVKLVNARPALSTAKAEREYTWSLFICTAEVLHARSRSAASTMFDVLETVLKFAEDFPDRLLVYLLQTYVMTEERVITIVKLSKQILFPNGYPGPSPTIPTPEEQAVIKEQLIRQIEMRIPPVISGVVLGPGDAKGASIADALEPLSSAACNAHLVLFLLDLIVLSLFPEFGVPPAADVAIAGGNGERSAGSSSASERDERSRTTSSTEGGGSSESQGRQ